MKPEARIWRKAFRRTGRGLKKGRRLSHVIKAARADIAYYEGSDDPMSMGRVIGARELLRVALGERTT
jgi:hypothetical protein